VGNKTCQTQESGSGLAVAKCSNFADSSTTYLYCCDLPFMRTVLEEPSPAEKYLVSGGPQIPSGFLGPRIPAQLERALGLKSNS
jgi:hypothetical protein